MGKVKALFNLFKAGEEVGNAAAWTNRTIIFNLLVALVAVGAAFGFKINIDADTLTSLAGGIIAAVSVGNSVMHAITDHRAGVPVRPDGGTNAPAGSDAGNQGKPQPDIRDPGGA